MVFAGFLAFSFVFVIALDSYFSAAMRYLGIDIGSSFIKGAVLDLEALTIGHVERLPFPEPLRGLPSGHREFSAAEIIANTQGLLQRLVSRAPDCAGVVMCSQMNSLVFLNRRGAPISDVITWQDQRALLPLRGSGGSYFDALNGLLDSEQRCQLGNESRPGLPLAFLFWFLKNRSLPSEPFTLATLPSCVVTGLCGSGVRTDLTHAYACGALNVETRTWHRSVLDKLGLASLEWPEIVAQGCVVGECRLGGRHLPVHAPVGDYQCSQVGAFLDHDELSLNISTGSAVIRLSPTLVFGDFQTRPYFDRHWLKTITHLPAGRALNALLKLLSELAVAQGLTLADPWDYILRQAELTHQTDLRVDPAFYHSAMGDHGSLTNVCEDNLTVGHLFRSAFAGMADNYAKCAGRVAPARDWSRLVFSGGLALKAGLLRQLICNRLGQAHRVAASNEDTLLGLLVLAQAFTGRVPSVADAIALTSKHYIARNSPDMA